MPRTVAITFAPSAQTEPVSISENFLSEIRLWIFCFMKFIKGVSYRLSVVGVIFCKFFIQDGYFILHSNLRLRADIFVKLAKQENNMAWPELFLPVKIHYSLSKKPFIPSQRFFQALPNFMAWLVAQQLAGLGYVCQ